MRHRYRAVQAATPPSVRRRVPHRRAVPALAALLALLCAALLTGCTGGDGTDGGRSPSTGSDRSTRSAPAWAGGLPAVAAADLPEEARETLRRIDSSGPYPYDKDGSVFGNFEGRLPDQRRGYYREFTVPTPGEDDRGARRVVTGDGGEIFYTDDHYESFEAVLR